MSSRQLLAALLLPPTAYKRPSRTAAPKNRRHSSIGTFVLQASVRGLYASLTVVAAFGTSPPTAYRIPSIPPTPRPNRPVGIVALVVQLSVTGSYASSV